MPLLRPLPWRRILGLLFALWIGMAVWHVWKPLPPGLDYAGPLRDVVAVEFLTDRAWVDAEGERQVAQEIFARKLELVAKAERLIVADMFLFNEFAGDPDGEDLRPLADALTEALIERKRERPEIQVIFITDPINTLYGGIQSPHLNALRSAGVEVVITD